MERSYQGSEVAVPGTGNSEAPRILRGRDAISDAMAVYTQTKLIECMIPDTLRPYLLEQEVDTTAPIVGPQTTDHLRDAITMRFMEPMVKS